MIRIADNFHGNQYTFMIISRPFLLRMRNVSDKILEKIKTHLYFMFNKIFFSENRVVYEIMRNNRAGQATDNNIKRRMRFACWIQKATTHSEHFRVQLTSPHSTHYMHTKHTLPHKHDGLIVLFKYFNNF
jgi:hypothetical protein